MLKAASGCSDVLCALRGGWHLTPGARLLDPEPPVSPTGRLRRSRALRPGLSSHLTHPLHVSPVSLHHRCPRLGTTLSRIESSTVVLPALPLPTPVVINFFHFLEFTTCFTSRASNTCPSMSGSLHRTSHRTEGEA